MPVIIVYGIPNETKEEEIEKFCEDILTTTAGIEELELKENDISCFFPPDRMSKDLGRELVIIVEGLFEKPKRTEAVRRKFADELGSILLKHFPDAVIRECFIKPFKYEWGFSNVSHPSRYDTGK